MGGARHQEGTKMQADEIRFLFAYDRWATRRVLAVLDGLDPAVWARTDVVGERGVGAILVPHSPPPSGPRAGGATPPRPPASPPSPNASRCRRSTSSATYGTPSGRLSTPG